MGLLLQKNIFNRGSHNFSSSASTSPKYIAFLYDILTNLTLNREDSRIVLNRGLVVATNETGLEARGRNQSTLYDSIDSKLMVRNLCASQSFHVMHFFLTFTCNQSKHVGTSMIRQLIDGEEWKNNFDGYHDLPVWEQYDIHRQLMQLASPLLLRNWMETRSILIQYLRGSPSSPYFPMDSIFVRDEFQELNGNLPHIHLMCSLKYEEMNDEQRYRIDNLVRASFGLIVRTDELSDFMKEGILESIEDWVDMNKDARDILAHHCNERCMKQVGYSGKGTDFACRKTNNLKASRTILGVVIVPLGNTHLPEVIEILRDIGLCEPEIKK